MNMTTDQKVGGSSPSERATRATSSNECNGHRDKRKTPTYVIKVEAPSLRRGLTKGGTFQLKR